MIYVIFNYIILNIFILSTLIQKIKVTISSPESNITLIINKIGTSYIYYADGRCSIPPPMPDEIYINGVNQNEIKRDYNFNESENEIQLIWRNSFNDGRCMFYGCNNITEIIISNFDTSQVT